MLGFVLLYFSELDLFLAMQWCVVLVTTVELVNKLLFYSTLLALCKSFSALLLQHLGSAHIPFSFVTILQIINNFTGD